MTPTAGAVRADPAFRRYLTARVLSSGGTVLTAVVLPVLIYRHTGSAGWAAALLLAEALPHLFGTLFAAAVTRLGRRRALVVGDLTAAGALASIPLAWLTAGLSAWHVLVAACLTQAAFVLLGAAHRGALTTLVGTEPAPAARVELRSAAGLAELMVPPLAGLAVTVAAPAPLLTLNAVTFLASAFLVRAALRMSTAPRSRELRLVRPGLRAGLRMVWRHQPSRSLAAAGTLHAAAGTAFLAMMLPWAEQTLGVPPSGDARLALVVSCWGLGVISARSLLPPLGRRFGALRLARAALLASLACGIGLLASTHWLPAVLIGLLCGLTHTLTTRAAADALGQQVRDPVRLLWRGVGPALGAVVAGAVALASTPRLGVAAGVVLLVLAAALRRGAAPVPRHTVPAQSNAQAPPAPEPDHSTSAG